MRKVYARYKSSGLKISEFCKRDGISLHTFRYWIRKIEKSNLPPRPVAGFQQIIQTEATPRVDLILVRLSNDRELELPADYPPKQLLQILQGLSC